MLSQLSYGPTRFSIALRHCKQVYSRFCSTAEAVCPSSVSPPCSGGGSSFGGCYPPSRSPLRREQTHICEPAPPALLPVSQRSRLAADITADAGGLLPHPFTPYLCRIKRPSAGLLSVAVLRHRRVTATVPHLPVSVGGLPSLDSWGGESGSSSALHTQNSDGPLACIRGRTPCGQVGRQGLEP